MFGALMNDQRLSQIIPRNMKQKRKVALQPLVRAVFLETCQIVLYQLTQQDVELEMVKRRLESSLWHHTLLQDGYRR